MLSGTGSPRLIANVTAESRRRLPGNDPDRTASFLRELYDAPILKRRDVEGHDETFVKLGVTGFALVRADVRRELTGDHVAFRVARETSNAEK